MEVSVTRGPFEGLYSYEIVMLVLGAVLFVVLLGLLVYNVIKQRKYGGLLVFFLATIPMIGYPSVQSIKFGKGLDELDKVAKGGTGAVAPDQKAATEKTIDFVEARGRTPQVQATVANAYRAIGDVDKAYTLAEKVSAAAPSEQIAKTLVPIYEAKLKQAVQSLPPGAATGGIDAGKTAEISKIARQLEAQPVTLSAQTRVTLAHGYAAIGDASKAAASVDKARAIQRDVPVDAELLQRIGRQPPSG